MTKVTFYSKPDCCLCDDALAVVERVAARHPFELEKVDITNDPALSADMGERVPVVFVDGEPAFELHVDERRLESILERRPEVVT